MLEMDGEVGLMCWLLGRVDSGLSLKGSDWKR